MLGLGWRRDYQSRGLPVARLMPRGATSPASIFRMPGTCSGDLYGRGNRRLGRLVMSYREAAGNHDLKYSAQLLLVSLIRTRSIRIVAGTDGFFASARRRFNSSKIVRAMTSLVGSQLAKGMIRAP